MLTPKELEIAKQLKSEGYTTTEILGYIGGTRTGSESSISTTRDKSEGKAPLYSFDEAKQDLSQTWQGVKGAFGSFMQSGREAKSASDAGEQSQVTGILQTAGNLAGTVSSGIGEVVKGGIKLALPQSGEQATKEAVGSAASKIMPIIEKTGVTDWYNALDANSKRSVDALIGTASLGLDVAGFGVAKKAAGAVKGATTEAVEQGAKTTSRLFPSQSPVDMNVLRGEVDRRILSSINDDVDELVKQTRGVEGKTKLMERRNTDVAEILKDRDVFRGLKVEAGKINPDEAIATIQKRKDILMDAKSRMLPSINRFVPVTTRDEVYDLASRAIRGKVPPADEASILARLQRQTNAMPDSVSAVELDALRAQFRKAARDARGLQKPGDHYGALENATRDLLFSKIDELPVSSRGEWAQLNNHIKNLINTEEYLDKTIRGQIVKGRRLGGYTAKLLGAIAGSNGGVFGTIAGMELGGMIQSIVMNNTLGSALKLKLLRNIDAPQEAIQLAEQMIRNAQDMRPVLLEAGEKGGARTAIYGTEKMLGVPSDKNIDVIRGTGVKTSRQDLGSSLQTDEVTRLAESQKSFQALPTTVSQPAQKGTPLSTATRQGAQKSSSLAKNSTASPDISIHASRFDTPDAFIKDMKKREYNPFGMDTTKLNSEDVALHDSFMDTAQQPKWQKVYEDGGNDDDVLKAIWESSKKSASVADDPDMIKRLTRERGAIGKPSNEFLLNSAKRELAKTPNDPKLKAFVSEMELMQEARKYKSAEEFVRARSLTKDEMLKRGADGHLANAYEIEIPISKIDGREPTPSQYKKRIYHGTDATFDDFDVNKSADGTIWFTDKKSSIASGDAGATGRSRVMERAIDENELRLAGWDEYDRYGTEELINRGYDGVRLPDGDEITYQIFYPDKLDKELKVTQPIEVQYQAETDTYVLYAGNHRVAQAEADGLTTIPAFVEDTSRKTRSQLTDIYNRAHATPEPTKSTTQKIKDFLLPPGIDRERGFVRNPFNPGEKIKAIDMATKEELATVKKYLKDGEVDKYWEDIYNKLAERYGIDKNAPIGKQIKRIDDLLEKTKTMDDVVGAKK